jgi:vacuolar-type H+-ATPase subunit I/STV1
MSTGDGMTAETGEEGESTVDYQIEELINRRTRDLEKEIERLEDELEELDNFARISLGERRIKGNEANLAEFSNSLTGFAERTFTKLNTIESRLDAQTLLLAAVVEALADVDDIEIDLTEVERYGEDQLVVSATPEKRLQDAIENAK